MLPQTRNIGDKTVYHLQKCAAYVKKGIIYLKEKETQGNKS